MNCFQYSIKKILMSLHGKQENYILSLYFKIYNEIVSFFFDKVNSNE